MAARTSQFFGDHRKTGSLRHFQYGFIAAEFAVIRADGLHERTVDLCVNTVTFPCEDHGVSRAFSAVCDRDTECLAGAEHFMCSLGEQFHSLFTGQSSLE